MLNKKKFNRIVVFLGTLVIVSFLCYLILQNIKSNIVFFYTPTEVITLDIGNPKKTFRVGGLIKPGSVLKRETKNQITTKFVITDCEHEIKISFNKILPNLFREKQGIVALGKFNKTNVFIATELLTKHSEVYSPPNIKKKKGENSFCYKGKK